MAMRSKAGNEARCLLLHFGFLICFVLSDNFIENSTQCLQRSSEKHQDATLIALNLLLLLLLSSI